MHPSRLALLSIVLLAGPGLSGAAAPPRAPDGGQVLARGDAADQMSEALDQRIVAEVAANLAMLRKQGGLAPVPPKVSGLGWPLGPVPGPGLDYHGISNFVDLDPAFPNQLRDYTCATRTYDTGDGYNHRGIDYFTWPFPWTLMDTGAVDVRAAAPGILIAKADGNDDRSCSFNSPDTPNYVVIQHADGTIARYLHLRRGSVTPRRIGFPMLAGDVLGQVGSSGISTGPHLHLELRASNTSGAAVIEPHTGQCNTAPGAWASQRPYREPRINRLSTHGAPPVQPSCPNTIDVPNFKDGFNPGENVLTLSAFRDQVKGQAADFRLLRPDNSAFSQWSFDLASRPEAPEAYNGSYWYWSHALPANAPHGLWTFEGSYGGETRRHYFRVGNTTTAIADTRGLVGAWYEPATSGQGLELHWIENDTLLVFFYGHRDNGENFYALGIRRGRFDYGQEIEVPLHRAIGGRFNAFDPGLITRPAWGTLRLTFASCTAAVAELDGTDGQQVLTLERLGRTPGLACE